MNRALIFGASGQMGYYLSEFLKSKGYMLSCPKRSECDFEQATTWDFKNIIEDELPDEIYNLVGLNYAPDSWHLPGKYMQVNGTVVLSLLQAIKEITPKPKLFQAGSAEVFEKVSVIQREDSNRLPENPYGLSKMLAMELVRIYREKYGLFACTGILFNAESPRRDKFFFAEKVVSEAVRIRKELLATNKWTPMKLGRLGARRDWGWAPEYVEVAWKMLQIPYPNDFVIGTGEANDCLEFVVQALKAAGLPDVEEKFDSYVVFEKEERKSIERNSMRAIPIKAKTLLDWEAKYKFKDVVRMLVEAEMQSEGILGKSIVAG